MPTTISIERSMQRPTSVSQANALSAEVVCQLIGSLIEFPVGELAVFEYERHGLRVLLHLSLEELVEARRGG